MPNLRGLYGSPPAPTSDEHGQLVALINNMSDGFMTLDRTGRVTLCNGSALGVLDANGLVGKQLSDVIDVIDKNGYPIDAQKMILMSSGNLVIRDWRLRYQDGTTVCIQVNSSPVRSGFGKNNANGFVVLLRDITKEKSVEEERDEFISVASHELRTPVAIAEGGLSNALLLAERANVSDPIKHSIKAAHDQVALLSSLINDLATLSRADRGKAAQTVETFSASELVNTLVHDYQSQAEQKHLVLQVADNKEVGLITSSRLYVQEILQNFITNSIKYTDKGGITLSATPEANGVSFSVTDTGIGIGKNEQSKLYTKFFRSEDWRVRQVNGTGLGLYVSAKLTKLLGGKLSMQSELNKGSTFTLFVPNMQMPSQT